VYKISAKDPNIKSYDHNKTISDLICLKNKKDPKQSISNQHLTNPTTLFLDLNKE